MEVQEHPDAFPCGTDKCDCHPETFEADYEKWVIDDVLGERLASKKCFRQCLTPKSLWLLRLYSHYLQGNLAIYGGIMDQPAGYLHAMEVIMARVSRIRAERIDGSK